MKRGDTIWYNTGGNGDRGLVLEVKKFDLSVDYPVSAWKAKSVGFAYAQTMLRCVCIRVLWHNGTKATMRPLAWRNFTHNDFNVLYEANKDNWYPAHFFKVEY